jgi:hypothetical protein
MPTHGNQLLGALDDGDDREARKGAAGDALALAGNEGEKPGCAAALFDRCGGAIVFRRQTAQALQYLLCLGHAYFFQGVGTAALWTKAFPMPSRDGARICSDDADVS